MDLHTWADRWGVPPAAVEELRHLFNPLPIEPVTQPPVNDEAAAQVAVRLEASRKGLRLWRNNVGVAVAASGQPVRYGLANDSKRVNEMVKSSDLIGIRPVWIEGRLIGQFVAREVKRPGWAYSGSKREEAQLNFLKLVASLGGDAAFTTGEGSL